MRSRLNIGGAGGVLGDVVATRCLTGLMGTVGTAIFGVAVLLVSLIMLFEVHPVELGRHLAAHVAAFRQKMEERRVSRLDRQQQLVEEERDVAKKRRRLEKSVGALDETPSGINKPRLREKVEPAAEPEPEPAPVRTRMREPARMPDPEPVPARAAAVSLRQEPAPAAAPAPEEEERPPLVEQALSLIKNVPAKVAARLKADDEPAVEDAPVEAATPSPAPAPPAAPPPPPAPPKPRPLTALQMDAAAPTSDQPGYPNYVLPPLSLLDELPPPEKREVVEVTSTGAQVLKDTMAEFGVEVEVTAVERGPVVTRYELLPAAGVRVERISGLSNNIALAMKAESVRVQAPIPGKGVVGIEVPNPKTTAVYLREILESDAWQNSKAALPLAFGQDVSGRVLVADLADMPHLLVAGATGSGKTVCMNSVLAGLLMSRTPDQLKLILIDPKIVEFSGYNHMPHLVVPVITDSKKVSLGLRWAITEMERRYKMFAKVGVRNIKAFNNRPIAKQEELFEDVPAPEEAEDKIPDRVPYIVIVVDELADLMLVAQAEIENQIARLAQLSRAVGIHMIIATQRPSVNVITGTIKANFPARISFQVAQKVDSRTILDAPGADKLLGKGDMLFLPPGSPKLIRAQGSLTTDGEIQRVVEHIKQQGQPQYEMAIKDKIEGKTTDLPDMEEDDELIEQSLEIIRQTRRASTSALQRRLRIGYTRAARIMDLLEQRGVVGPASGSDPREILIDLDGEVPANEGELRE